MGSYARRQDGISAVDGTTMPVVTSLLEVVGPGYGANYLRFR